MIEELRKKRIIEQQEQEKKILDKIKVKMDRIKATQQKILGPHYKDPENHYIGMYLFQYPQIESN